MLKACLTCGAPSDQPRCPAHRTRTARPRKPGATGNRGSTHASRKRRAKILRAANYRCFYCGAPATIGEHYIALTNGGTDTEDNLVASCRPCNQAKGTQTPEAFLASAWLEDRRKAVAGGLHIICLVGAPGAGKTWVRQHANLTIPHRGIDECGPRGQRAFRWGEMLRWLREQTGVVLVESNVIPHEFADRLRQNTATVVEITASDSVRERRLTKRDGNIRRARVYPVGYPIDITTTATNAVEIIRELVDTAATRRSGMVGGQENHDRKEKRHRPRASARKKRPILEGTV